jgi:hypothetical protein
MAWAYTFHWFRACEGHEERECNPSISTILPLLEAEEPSKPTAAASEVPGTSTTIWTHDALNKAQWICVPSA